MVVKSAGGTVLQVNPNRSTSPAESVTLVALVVTRFVDAMFMFTGRCQPKDSAMVPKLFTNPEMANWKIAPHDKPTYSDRPPNMPAVDE